MSYNEHLCVVLCIISYRYQWSYIVYRFIKDIKQLQMIALIIRPLYFMLFMWSLDTPKRQHVILFIVIKSLLWSTSDF